MKQPLILLGSTFIRRLGCALLNPTRVLGFTPFYPTYKDTFQPATLILRGWIKTIFSPHLPISPSPQPLSPSASITQQFWLVRVLVPKEQSLVQLNALIHNQYLLVQSLILGFPLPTERHKASRVD